jgi:hypothetical protein
MQIAEDVDGLRGAPSSLTIKFKEIMGIFNEYGRYVSVDFCYFLYFDPGLQVRIIYIGYRYVSSIASKLGIRTPDPDP